jgi:hypothetical protein
MRMMLDIASLQQIFYFVEYPNNLSPTNSNYLNKPNNLSPTNSNYLNKSNKLNYPDYPDYIDNLNYLNIFDLRISPRPAAIAITEELSSPALGGTASK